MILALRSTRLWAFTLVAVSVQNAWWAPFGDCRFDELLKESAGEYFSLADPNTCPVFQALLPELLSDKGQEDRLCEHDIAETTFLTSQVDHAFAGRGTRVALSRFLGFLKRHRVEDRPAWGLRKLALFAWGLTTGRLLQKEKHAKDTMKIIVVAKPEDDPGTLAAQEKNADGMRLKYDNRMHLALQFYLDDENKRRLDLITEAMQPISLWHGRQNSKLRTVENSCSWLEEMCSGKYFECLRATIHTYLDHGALRKMGFVMELKEVGDLQAEVSVGHCFVAMEDDYADLLLNLSLTLVACRLRRLLWLSWGWPCKFVLVSSCDMAVAEGALKDLKQDWNNFLAVREALGAEHALVQRSVFQTRIVLQMVLLCQSAAWIVTPALVALAKEQATGIISTQVIEDGMAVQRR